MLRNISTTEFNRKDKANLYNVSIAKSPELWNIRLDKDDKFVILF